MNKEKKKILEVAKNLILLNLKQNLSNEALIEIYEINSGNKKVLLEHLKAVNGIINDAINLLGDDKNV